MRISPICTGIVCNRQIAQSHSVKKANITEEPTTQDTFEKTSNVAFKGDIGAAKGILKGALFGAAVAAITVATGGLATIVAAVGTTGTILGGAAAGTHLGGIIGGLTSDE